MSPELSRARALIVEAREIVRAENAREQATPLRRLTVGGYYVYRALDSVWLSLVAAEAELDAAADVDEVAS